MSETLEYANTHIIDYAFKLFLLSPLKEIGAPRSQFINKVEPSLPSGGENLQGDRRIAQQQQQQQQHRKELKAKRLRSFIFQQI